MIEIQETHGQFLITDGVHDMISLDCQLSKKDLLQIALKIGYEWGAEDANEKLFDLVLVIEAAIGAVYNRKGPNQNG